MVFTRRNPPLGTTPSVETELHGRFFVPPYLVPHRLDPDQEIFTMINERLGRLDMDLFATRFSNRLPWFVSWRPDPMAEATDGFLQDWSAFAGYAHPPWCLVSRVLFKTQAQAATLVLVVPLWQTQAWFPQPVDMLIEPPILLPHNSRTIAKLRLPTDGQASPVNRLQGLRMRFEAEGISEEAIRLILASWRSKTDSNYDSAWRKWQSWCSTWNTNPFATDWQDSRLLCKAV